MKWLKRLKVLLLWTGGTLVLAGMVAWLAGTFHEKTAPGVVAEPPSAAPAFSATGAARGETEPLIEKTPGTLTALRETIISARIMARIDEIAAGAGDTVAADQVLVRLDDKDLGARAGQAAQASVAARARLAEAEKDHARMKSLARDGAVPTSALDSAEAAHTAARAEVARLEQAAGEAGIGREFATLRAPFTGRIVDRYAEAGDTAMPGQALLKMYDPEQMRIETHVRESLAGSIKIGDTLQVWIDALNQSVEARVAEIVPQSEPGSRSVLVKVALPKRDDLFPGMFARLLIPAGEAAHTYVPKAAVQRVGQLAYVWVVEDNQPPRRRFVQLGSLEKDGWIEVVSGIDPGEKIGVI